MNKKYTLTITEKQAALIKNALEEYFRLRMNQTWDFANDICFEGFDYDKQRREGFGEVIERRDMLKIQLENLLNVVHPLHFKDGKFREQTSEMEMAQDIWQVIRHELWKENGNQNDFWCVDSRTPLRMSDEPLPEMRKLEE